MWKPCDCNSALSLRVLLHVQRKGETGSPREGGSTRASSACNTLSSCVVRRLRPPPGCRMRRFVSGGVDPWHAANSCRPHRMVVSDMPVAFDTVRRSEEHTSELQSPCNLVCRLLLEKKKQRLDTRG